MKKIKNVSLYVNRERDAGGTYTRAAADVLLSHGAAVKMLARDRDAVTEHIDIFKFVDNIDGLLSGADALVMLGGDGTMLDVCGEAAKRGVPVLGINLGHLGFLTSVERNETDKISALFTGEYTVEERMMCDVSVADGDMTKTFAALNEATVFSSTSSKVASFSISCDGRRVINFKADGIIVSTPTGSTAYSLSAGGPIIDPSTELVCVTPICPHVLGSRPIVFSADSVIEISGRTDSSDTGINVTVDGREQIHASENATVTVKRSPLKTKIIKIGADRFFDIVNTKLYNR